MKKRILCVMLTLIMLVSLIPAGAISASAASLKISEPAITVLKKMTRFEDKCYRVGDTQQYRIGYGTVCDKTHKENGNPHTMRETEADKALREYLTTLDKKVNSFASNNGMSFKQNQHDALVIFSYGVGTAWMNGNGVVKTAIVNNAGTNELLSAMASIQNDMTRRKIEVNMYVNGVYSNTVPTYFAEVTYHIDQNAVRQGATMTQGNPYTMHFDTTKTVAHTPTPIWKGHTFLGWYTAAEGGERVTKLTADCAGKSLYAVWQENGLKEDEDLYKVLLDNVHYTFKVSQLPARRAFFAPNGKEYEAGTKALKDMKNDTKVSIQAEYMDAKGIRWGNIDQIGWVVMPGSSASGIGGNYDADIDVTVTVTNTTLNSRVNASIFSKVNGSYRKGDKLRIISTENGDGFLWGQVAEDYDDNTPIGWVALKYTNWNSVKDIVNNGESDGQNDTESNNSNAIAKATITFNGYVNLRSGAGTDNKIVGALADKETVEVYEIKTVNGHQWGRTNGGWFCLTYADLTMLGGNKIENISNEGALNYVFPGMYYGATDTTEGPRVSPSNSAEFVEHTRDIKKDGKVVKTVNLWPVNNEKINIHNMVVRSNDTWAKISWRVDVDGNGSDDTTKYGWLKVNVDEKTAALYGSDVSLAISTSPVGMDPVKYTVVADELTVRDEASNAGNALSVKLTKGIEIQVNALKLVGENIWGFIDNEHVYLDGNGNNSTTGAFDGWVNLASKNVSRNGLPSVDEDKPTPTGKIGTIVGSDNVNVRITGSSTATKLGSLPRGTTANILEISADGKWYNLDVDVDDNPETGSWVSKMYVEVKDGTISGGSGSGSNGSSNAPVTTGIGIVANTYSGVNVRSGAGTGYALVGKLLPGTQVNVLEMKQGGAAKWARTDKGWVCMDYITMLTEETSYPEGAVDPDKGTNVGSYDELEKTTTTAVYTGRTKISVPIYSETMHWNDMFDYGVMPIAEGAMPTSTVASEKMVRETALGENVTVYELIKVTERVDKYNGSDDGHGYQEEVIRTSYWARVNDGYIFNPQDFIELDALDEQVHTLTNEKLNIRKEPVDGKILGKLEQGDQVKVTALDIRQDKVWGRIEHDGITGWIRLDYMTEGAYYVNEKPDEPTTPPSNGPILGAGSDNGGFVTNPGGYRYTGKVINTNQVNVRATPSTSATVTTTLKSGQSLVIYETTTSEAMAWGRCDAGWVYLLYVDMTPCVEGVQDARVVANNVPGIIYTDANGSDTVGTYAGMSVIDIYEYVGKMARTDRGWVSTNDLL